MSLGLCVSGVFLCFSLSQIDQDPVTEDCPTLTNSEFPLTVPRISALYTVFLGSVVVQNLLPKKSRVVFPRVSRVPGVIPNSTNACILVYIDSANNVPELYDGPTNVAGQRVAMTDIAR